MARLLLLGYNFRNGDQHLNRKKAHTVLVIRGQVLKHGYHLVYNNRRRHRLDELGQVGGGLAAHHGGLIVYEYSELCAKLFLNGGRDLWVGGGVEAASRHLGRKPVCLGEPICEGNEVLLDLLLVQLLADLVQ